MSIRTKFLVMTTSVMVQQLRGDEVIAEKTFEVADIPEALTDGELGEKSLAAYGLSQLLQDRAKASGEDKIPAMEEVFELLKSGQWRVRREGSASGKVTIDPYFAAAVAQMKGISVLEATNALKGISTENRKAIRGLEAVSDIIKALKEKAAETAGENLLDDLL